MRVRFWELCNWLELIRSSFLGLVQTKPVQSKTASLLSGPVRLSCWTGPDRALPQTGIVWTGGIIAHQGNSRLYLIIDAVDESLADDRRQILHLLFKLCSNNCCTIKVFIASRPVGELEQQIRATHAFVRMQDVNRLDIQKFINTLTEELQISENIRPQVAEYLLEHAQGVFLGVHLIRDRLVEFVEKVYSRNDIFQFLKSLPTELEDMYKLILKELESTEDKNLMRRRMFEMVLFARRPLRLPEFQHALAISDPSDNWTVPRRQSFEDNPSRTI